MARSALVLALSCIAATASAVAAGGRAPEIGMADLDGHQITIASLRGQVFVVDFWATWCPPCEDELPVLQRLYASSHARGFTVIAVSADSNRANLDRFVSRLHLTFPVIHDAHQVLPHRYQSTTQPTSYIVDRRGIVRFVHAGFRSSLIRIIEREVATLIAEPRP